MMSFSWFKKINGKATFGKEITVAVVLKFLLLAGLWWMFFKGHKQPIDDGIIAAKLFGDPQTINQLKNGEP